MKPIFTHTITNSLRQKHLQVLGIVLLLLFLLVAFNSSVAYKARMQNFEKARQAVRNAWLNQGPQNPHACGTYGTSWL
jgi:hypothetical protein